MTRKTSDGKCQISQKQHEAFSERVER